MTASGAVRDGQIVRGELIYYAQELGRDGGVTGGRLADGQEPELLARARSGDKDAFGALVAPYLRELHVHCYRTLGSVHDAEHVQQEVLMRAWRHLENYDGRGSFRGWLYRSVLPVGCAEPAPSRQPHACWRTGSRRRGTPATFRPWCRCWPKIAC
jgi:RNA polymerase sigma-70 factor (ECF subfamily)